MASADTFCLMCEEDYNKRERSPKSLPCKHTFCRQCLLLYAQEKHSDKKLPCPTCNKAFPCTDAESGVDNLPINFTIFNSLGHQRQHHTPRVLLQKDKTEVGGQRRLQERMLRPQTDETETDVDLDLKASLRIVLDDTTQNAKRHVNRIVERVQTELDAWTFQMMDEIDKVSDAVKVTINTEPANDLDCTIWVNSNLRLDRLDSGRDRVTIGKPNLEDERAMEKDMEEVFKRKPRRKVGQQNGGNTGRTGLKQNKQHTKKKREPNGNDADNAQQQIDVNGAEDEAANEPAVPKKEPRKIEVDAGLKNCLSLPIGSGAAMSVSRNGTILLTMYDGKELCVYKYDNRYYTYQSSMTVAETNPDMIGCQAFITPNAQKIVLSKTVSSGWSLFKYEKKRTSTWVLRCPELTVENHYDIDFSELLSVSDSRLLYRQEDFCGPVITILNFNHELQCDIIFPHANGQGTKILSGALNPTSNITALIEEAQGRRELVFYNPDGQKIRNVKVDRGLITCADDNFIVLSDFALHLAGTLCFHDWTGRLTKILPYENINRLYRIAPFPPDSVGASANPTGSVLHILSRGTLLNRKRVIAYRLD